jgi:hypothetical protein
VNPPHSHTMYARVNVATTVMSAKGVLCSVLLNGLVMSAISVFMLLSCFTSLSAVRTVEAVQHDVSTCRRVSDCNMSLPLHTHTRVITMKWC